MAHGTSAHGEGLCRLWPDAGQAQADLDRWSAGRIEWRWRRGRSALGALLSVLNTMAGLVAGLMLITTSQTADTTVCLAILLATGAAAAGLAIRPLTWDASTWPEAESPHRRDPPNGLVAQMHHELRTPLNAVIGFSEVMRRELHGPLGHARYQEYAAHISESGSRLLRASEDALAVAETMSVLLADRHVPRRQRLPLARLVRQAWSAAGEGLEPSTAGLRLRLHDQAGVEIMCEGRSTIQALQHLLAEAAAAAAPHAVVVVRGDHDERERNIKIEIAVEPSCSAPDPALGAALGQPVRVGSGSCNGLRLMLARSLIEMQGGRLDAGGGPGAGSWVVRVALPMVPSRAPVLRAAKAAAAARLRAAPARPGGSAAAAAARASAGSRAVPAA